MNNQPVKVTKCPPAYSNGYLAYMNKNGVLDLLSHIEGFASAARSFDKSKLKKRKR